MAKSKSKSPAEVALNAVLVAYGGFDDMTVCRFVGRLLNDIGVPTMETHIGIKFKPIGGSTFGSYIYKSGVMKSFNEHHAPFSATTLSFQEVLKELSHTSKYGYLAVYNKIENLRTIYLCKIQKTFEQVYGATDCTPQTKSDRPKCTEVRSEGIPEEEMTSYTALRIPYKNSLFSKSLDGETTIWSIMKLIRGMSKGSAVLQKLTQKWREQTNGKHNFPVIYPNYHLYEINGELYPHHNDLVVLDFDLIKQGFSVSESRRIRSIVESYAETICVAESYTRGNFWALVAMGECRGDRQSVGDAVCSEIERRLEYFGCRIDRAGCRVKQARLVIYDRYAVIKNPTERFVEK